MAFSADTKILTSKGWKLIGEISGHDRVLVRNFLGEAEFSQPFALKKSWHDGEAIQFGSTYWGCTTTPEHKILYKLERAEITEERMLVKDLTVDKHKKLYRSFRYLHEDKTTQMVRLYGGVQKSMVISDKDWYTIVAYTTMMGYISKDKNPRLKFMIGSDDKLLPLAEILNKLGVTWSYGYVNGSSVVTVNRDNNLARKLRLFLGARKRTKMYLPDKLLYGSSQSLMRHFLDTVLYLVAKPSKKRPNQMLFKSTNKRLLDSLRLLCTLCGYAFSMSVAHGEYIVYVIPGYMPLWSVRFINKIHYSGYVYEIDLFDGLVYVTERSLPVWIPPK